MRYMVFLQKIRLKLRGVKQRAQGHTARKRWSGEGQGPALPGSEDYLFSHSSSGRLGTAP